MQRYDCDVVAWANEQAAFIRAGQFDMLDLEHIFSDESPDHIMRLAPALQTMESIGFQEVKLHYRQGVNALVSGVKSDV